ncbi:hypothetical protein ACIRVK_24465 [Streptomyces sp. NPDC101152]|uniref:hypothetical protein n=1 Tax=Streptomyces sp. NPDC101152 TaxID=3366116 RepID=UPI00380F7190
MAVDQLPGQVREFANYLNGLLARVNQAGGWCAVFWQRDPDGMRACLEGREVPPWDVVEALLYDLAAGPTPGAVPAERERARALHAAALDAHDARPGGRDALGDRLDVILREQRYAADRQAELGRRLASAVTREEADALRLDLAWARDDHERATARCAELRSRMDRLGRRTAGDRAAATRRTRLAQAPVYRIDRDFPDPDTETADTHAAPTSQQHGPEDSAPAGGHGGAYGSAGHDPGRQPDPNAAHTAWDLDAAQPAQAPSAGRPAASQPSAVQEPVQAAEPPTSRQRKRRRGSARFAGMGEGEAVPVVVPPSGEPVRPAAEAAGGRGPRGARFAGAAGAPEAAESPVQQAEPVDPAASHEVAGAVARLVRLRAEERSGEAHALLVEAAHWPVARFPLLADELQRAGLGADWATLLWEAASLPAERLVAAADALAVAGRGADGEQVLRQGVARPAGEIGRAVLGLAAEGRHREVRALLDAYVRVRTPEEAARSAEPDPGTLVPLLLEAARGVSDERHWDLVHALRVAGFAA